MDASPDVLTRLSQRVDQLESRVSRLEHPAETIVPALAAISSTIELPPTKQPSPTQAGAIVPVLGKAMFGMAGAYLLRAVAEAGSFPKLAVVALAIAYAGAWLAAAVRVSPRDSLRSAIYTGTSTLILTPMLWELTLRFEFLSAAGAAFLLGAFLFAAYLLAWKHILTSVVWIATLTTAVASIALLAATHQLIPFLGVLLLMAVLSEAAADCNRWLNLRPIAAIAADFGILALLLIYTSPEADHADYSPLGIGMLLAPPLLLLAIYGGNVVLRTIAFRQRVGLFETVQAVFCFALAADAILHSATPAGVVAFGFACLTLSAVVYLAIFKCFSGITDQRNYHVFALWSVVLLVLGCFLSLHPSWQESLLGVAAVAATWKGVQTSRLTLAFHGLIYSVAAAYASGWLLYVAHTLAGSFPTAPATTAWIVAALVVLCYAIGGQFRGDRWGQRLLQVLSATFAITSLAAVLISLIVWLTATVITPGAPHVAVIRTLGTCAFALALAWLGPQWDRIELIWIAYATLAFIAAKLLFEDLRHGRAEFIAASIFLYAVTFILVPRLVKVSSRRWPTALSGHN
jgi:hypothetical protein